MSTVEGHLNGLPPSMTARLFYFNETTFAKAGLSVPDSWDALLAAGPVFRDRLGPDYFPLDVNFQDLTAMLYSWQIQRRPAPFIDEATRELGPDLSDLTAMAEFYQQLVAALQHGKTSPVSATEALQGIRLIELALQSQQRGRTVEF